MQQILIQSIRPMTTAHLAQTMTLMSLTVEELQQEIDTVLASNPALELVDERRCPTCHRLLTEKGPCPICSAPQNAGLSMDPVVFISPREDFYTSSENQEDYDREDDYSVNEEDLPSYVLRQIGPDLNPKERIIAAYLLTNLDEDGFITVNSLEVAQYFHVPLSTVEGVRRVIQKADPLGVGSVNPKEALLVQIDILSETQDVPELIRKIIEDEMDLLTHRQYNELAHKFNVSIRRIQNCVKYISENLNPFPARSHWGDIRHPGENSTQVYHQPDIIINYLNDKPENPLVVEIVIPLKGTLRINPLFKTALKEADEDKKEEWQNDLEKASLFIKCLQQRNHTIERLVQKVVVLQRPFITKGEKYLKPVTRVQISRELEVHESTISRAVSNKTVQLPNRRIIPLSSFFDRSLNVRSVLREIIGKEDKPMSDAELVNSLSKEGYNVARRTVAKYRAMEGILPAHLRNFSP